MLVVVGGQSRNVGKTSVVAGLIRELRDWRWTALKITQYGNSVCDHHSGACGCEPASGEEVALTEEYAPGETDSGRFLAAGAVRSFWLRTPAGGLPQVAGLVRKAIAQGGNTIVESNSVLEVVRPDLFLMVLDFACTDFKESSLRFADRAGAYVITGGADTGGVRPAFLNGNQTEFYVKPPDYVSPALVEFMKSMLIASSWR